jgi:hypothetical protein
VANSAQAASLTHQYNLNNTLADSLGGSSLVSNGGTLSASGYSFAPNQGLSLSNSTTGSQYSIVLDYSFADTSGYRKIIDFKNLTSDGGLYNLNTNLDFFPLGAGTTVVSDNVPVRLVLTRNATGTTAGYFNGVQQFSFTDSSSLATFSEANNIINFFIDDSATGQSEASAGSVSKILLYDDALSVAEVGSLGNVNTPIGGGTTAVPEPFTVIGTLVGGTAALRMRKKLKSAGK